MSQNNELKDFILKEINNSTFFRTKALSKMYVNKVLGIDYNDITFQKFLASTSIKIGHITKELEKLGLIIDYSKSTRHVWKNLFKDNLIEELKLKNNAKKTSF